MKPLRKGTSSTRLKYSSILVSSMAGRTQL
uniref:Uncharacterized protein MANES_12G110000 n=1 Tax=Rhizophora mucronata TaxID=61149 RepID=A0A2P2PCU5_RHIMU